MTYDSIYESVLDQDHTERDWDEHAHVGDRESLNVADEALGRHADSSETGLRIRDFETGETETYSFAELAAGANRVSNYAFGDWAVKPGSMGKVTPGVDVALLDDDGTEVEQGAVGEIAVKRDEDARGSYWGRPEATLETFTGPWLRTGDLVRQDEDGYFWYVSRDDDVIISAGYRIGPEEVEATLLDHPAVEEAAVVGKPDETRGEIVAAFVTLVDDHATSDELPAELREFAREELSNHEYPREGTILEALPKTASGKIKRSALLE